MVAERPGLDKHLLIGREATKDFFDRGFRKFTPIKLSAQFFNKTAR